MLKCYCLVVLYCILESQGAPLTNQEAMMYLVEYGYLDPEVMKSDSKISGKEMKSMVTDAVSQFQQFVGLQDTGKVDMATRDAMQLPRCGVKDKFEYDHAGSRRKRYTLWGSKWMKQELTYRIKRYPKLAIPHRMLRAAVDKEMFMAFSVWSNVTNLLFKQVTSKPDIDIRFHLPDINDSDFETGGLAYARMPPIGDIIFNDDKKWTIRRGYGWNLLAAAVHEIGHSLGLAHSNVSDSIMYPMLTRGYTPQFTLHDDDIAGIQELYEKKTNPTPDLCENAAFDCIFKNPDGSNYVFKGEYFWKLGFDGMECNFPNLIRYHWHGLPADIDTALATSSGRTYFFKGDKYWAYQYTTPIPGHPRLISEGWPGIPSNLDASTWYRNSQFYFFKDDMFWLYDSHQRPNVPHDFPKHISEWGDDVDGELDDVLYHPSGYFYFFKNGEYLRYNNYSGLMDHPRSVKKSWFHCEDDTRNVQ